MTDGTPEQNIAEEFNVIADELPADYAKLATAMTRHATASTPSTRKDMANALAETLVTTPPALLHSISENLKQVNNPRNPETNQLPYRVPAPHDKPTWPASKPTMQLFIDSNARINELDETFWQTILSESLPALHQNESNLLELESCPIKVLMQRTTIKAQSVLIHMTAIYKTADGELPIGEAIIIDSLTKMF